MSRLAEIYRSEKSEGGGLGSTLGKRFAEKIDPRKMFDQQGLLAAMLPKLFKAYSATGSNNIKNTAPTRLATAGVENRVDGLIGITHSMAKDMNVIKNNVIKLVKSVGMTPTRKAETFFAGEDYRESLEEDDKKGGKKGSKGKLGFMDSLKSSAGAGIGKGFGLAAIGLGIGGFLTGLALGGAAINALGGAKGIKDMLVSLGEGLSSFSGTGLVALGSLLGAGMLFGAYSGKLDVGKQGGAALGITAIGLGLGGFLAGLALGGAGISALGGSGGVKQMLVDLAEGLNAFSPSSMAVFGSLLAAGGLFGVVTGVSAPAGLAMMGGTMLGMTAIGVGLGGFLAGLALGGKGIDMLGGGGGVKDMLVNLATGLNAFSGIDAGNLAGLALAIPAFGLGMATFFGLEGIGGLVKSFTGGIKGLMDWVFGNKPGKTPLQQLAEDLKLFDSVNGDNLSKVGQGVKDLGTGVNEIGKTSTKGTSKKIGAIAKSTTGVREAKTVDELDDLEAQQMIDDAKAAGAFKTSPTPSKSTSSAPSTSPTQTTSEFDYDSYAQAIGQRESGGNYKAVNSLGYLGKYQFGAMALEDMGLVKSGVGRKGQKALDDSENWTIDGGKQAFLNNPQLQDSTMKKYTMQNRKALERLKVLNKDSSTEEVGGYLASAHLLGPGGARDLSQGKSGSDAYGTSASTYYALGTTTQKSTTLASASPSSGPMVASASINAQDGARNSTSGKGNVNIDNSQKTNVASSGGNQKGRSASAYDGDMVNTLAGRQYA